MGLFDRLKKGNSATPTTAASEHSAPSTSGSMTKEYEKEGHVAVDSTDAHSHNSATAQKIQPNVDAEAVGAEGLAATTPDPVKDEDDDGVEYPKAMKLALITIALCLSVFCMALDNTIISTAIPKITDEFKALNDVGWYGSAYLLCTCAFQLFFGKLYTFLSIKWVYMTALIIFEIGSAVCGAAPNSTALILGRAVAGLGSAGIFSGAVLIVSNTVPLKKRPTYMGLIGGMYGIASVAGPLMGGAFTDKVSWRWCFYINLPIGAVTALFIAVFYNPTKSAQKMGGSLREKLDQFDIFGTLVFLPMIVCLLLALQWGGSKYPWSNGRIIALFVVFGVLLFIFVGIQLWKQDNGTVPPRILTQRTVGSAAWFAATLGAAFFIFVYYLPIWFQAIKNASAVGSGIRNIPMVLSLVVASIVCGALVQTTGQYAPFIIASSVLMAIGAGMLSTLEVDSGAGKWIGYQIIFGVGVGLGMQNCLIAVQAVLPVKDIPIGTAIIMFSQTLGGALFIAVAQNVFANKLQSNVKSVVPGIDPKIVLNTGATELRDVINRINASYLGGVQIAYNDALISTFYVATAMSAVSFFGAVFVEWKSIKGKKIEMAAA